MTMHPANWRTFRMEEIQAKEKYALNGGPFGSKLVSRMYVTDGVPVIRGVNLPMDKRFSLEGMVFVSDDKADELSPNTARPGDVIFTQRGTLGQVGLIPEDCRFKRFVISQSQMKLTVNPKIADAKFVYYYFRAPETVHRITSLASSSGVPHINLEALRKFDICLPPVDIQKRIASILSAYDDLIENNTRRIAILEEMARRLYDEWFVHFRFPGHEDAMFIETEDGRVPKGWEYKRLQDFIELVYGKALKAADREEGPYPVYGSSGIVGTHKDYLVEGPGIILGRKGNVGSVHWTEHPFFPIDTVYYVKTKLPLEYVFFNLQTQNFLNNDAAVPGLNRNQAYALPFLKPSDELLEKFTLHCKPLYDLVRKLRRKNDNLRTQRDLLLPKLVTGEIKVGDAKNNLEDAVA